MKQKDLEPKFKQHFNQIWIKTVKSRSMITVRNYYYDVHRNIHSDILV